MAYQGIVPTNQITEQLNDAHYDVKAALRITQNDINKLISDMADPTKTSITIDGRTILKSDTVTLQIAVNNKLDNLQNQSTTILAVFQQLFKMEQSITGQ